MDRPAFCSTWRRAGDGVAVQLLDAKAVPVPGYDFSDFVPLTDGGVREAVSWKGHDRIPEGGPYHLRVALTYEDGSSPKVYAIYVNARDESLEAPASPAHP